MALTGFDISLFKRVMDKLEKVEKRASETIQQMEKRELNLYKA